MEYTSEEDLLAIALALSQGDVSAVPSRSPAVDGVSEEDQLAIAIALSQGDVSAVPSRSPAVTDFAGEILARRVVAEEARRKQAGDDAATAGLIRRMALDEETATYSVVSPALMHEETARLIAAMLRENEYAPAVSGVHSDPIFHMIRTHKDVVAYRAMLAPITTFLKGVAQGVDVHTLDGHVLANIGKLHAIGDAFGVDNPALTSVEMHAYLLKHSDFYKGYEAQVVTKEQLVGYVDAALARASEQISTLSMYSRVISLIHRLGPKNQQRYLKRLLDAISENYLTEGGCFQGVRNRIYVRYVDMMNNLMGHG